MKRLDRKIAIILVVTVSVLTLAGVLLLFRHPIKAYFNGLLHKSNPAVTVANVASTDSPAQSPSPDLSGAKDAITKEPPKHPTSGMSGSTTAAPDGGQTVRLSDAGGDCPDLSSLSARKPTGTSPSSIEYSDKTGSYPNLGNTLKSYLTTNLLWSNEIGSMYKIVLEDAGDTGWEGQYCGAYSINSRGDITSSYAYIILNSHYHKSSNVFTDYMKLTLSHEYGHHFSLSHKWVDQDLGIGTRFPDAYYNVRPLSKAATATDYSKGWQNCDAEIVAEDYSYFYSGYGFQQMHEDDGLALPSSGTKSWFESLSSGQNSGGSGASQLPKVDETPPTVTISEPTQNSSVSGSFSFKVSASDNVSVIKVGFYLNDQLIAEDGTAPYETTIDTQKYENGPYVLKAVAYDSRQTAQTTVNVNFNNGPDTEKPVVTITNPKESPYQWASGDLVIEATATDNKKIDHMELFVNNRSAAKRDGSYIGVSFAWFEGNFQDYVFKVRAYDAAGNFGEASVTISK